MKKYLLVYIVALCTLMGCKDNSGLYGLLTDYDLRISELEKLCEDINTNVQSIQVIIEAQQTGDYITAITPIKNGGVEIGYTITFAKHEPITIYHGQNGTNGTNGADGHTPVIGVAKDTDGVYYWTLDGKWLLDSNGNKLRVTGQDGKDGQDGANGKDGEDGKDGQDGTDGKDGQDGTDGKDGVTPQLKIEDGYWYISYDNGATWTQLGKATGEDGKDGQNGSNGTDGTDGKDGKDGDSMFQSVTQDENYVYFTLADGTVIKIAKGTSMGEDQPNSEFMFIVTYDANGGEGVMRPDTFYYGISQDLSLCGNNIMRKDHIFTSWNTKKDGNGITYKNGQNLILNKNVTLYAQWKENKSGAFSVSQTKQVYFSLGNLQYQANNDVCRFALEQWEYLAITAHDANENADLFCWGTGANITFYGRNTTFTDWGINQIDLDGYKTWRTLSSDEWEYIRAKRNNADSLWILATVNNIYGIILLPDDWEYPAGITYQNASNLDVKQWYQMETNGAVFLPAAGNNYVQYKGSEGYYWSSSSEDRYGLCFHFGSTYNFNGWYQQDKYYSMSVRLVKEAK